MNAVLSTTHLATARPVLPAFDSRRLLPDAGPEVRKAAKAARARAKEARAPAAAEQSQRWAHERLAKNVDADGESRGETRELLLGAVQRAVLGPAFRVEVRSPDDPRQVEQRTIAELLSDRDRYHHCLCRDPVEPDYGNGAWLAKLYLKQDVPCLNSFAHGGRTYRLETKLPVITIAQGGMADAVKRVLRVMRESGRFFDLGDLVVTVGGERPSVLNETSLAFHLAEIVRFEKSTKDGPAPIDPPEKLCQHILRLTKADRKLNELRGIATGPFIRPRDGSLVGRPGYDAKTGRYAHFDEADFPPVPESTDETTLLDAHELLWAPFKELRLSSKECRTALMAALLTAAIRPALDKAPMFLSLAPVHGSGKTLVTETLGALALGHQPALMASIDTRNRDEMRKRFTSAILPPAEPVIILDNASGYQDSPELAAFLTAASWTDRILGLSRIVADLPNRALILMSGKNVTLHEEIARRTLSWTIDPGENGVYANVYKTCPLEMTLKRRPEMVVAALTLMRAAKASGRTPTERRVPSYGEWDLLVRQTILWIGETLLPGRYADPLDMIEASTQSTSDRFDGYEFLSFLREEFGDGPFRALDLALRVAEEDRRMRVHLEGLARVRGEPLSAVSIGRYLSGLRNQRLGDLVLRSRQKGHTNEWIVERVTPRA